MDENIEVSTLYSKVIRISWGIMGVVSVILILISLIFFPGDIWYKLTLSYIFGAMTNLFAFNLLKNNISNVSSNAKKAIAGSTSNYAIRLLIYAFVLFVSFQSDKLNPYLVASGFITVRIAIYLATLLNKK